MPRFLGQAAVPVPIVRWLPEWFRIEEAVVTCAAEMWLRQQSVEWLQVKTLGPSSADENYAITRAFYQAIGFKPLEEPKQIWDAQNPCLIMIKRL